VALQPSGTTPVDCRATTESGFVTLSFNDYLLAATLVVASATDLAWARVPNWLSLPAAVTAVCLHARDAGWAGAAFGLEGWFVGLLAFLGFYAAGGMGAGDVKLMAAVGAFVGPSRALGIALWAALAGGVYAVGLLLYLGARRGVPDWSLATVRREIRLLVLGGAPAGAAESLRTAPKIRYAVAVAAGAIAERALGGWG